MTQKRIWIKDTPGYLDYSATIKGWVHSVRNHGKLIFVDVRDRTGIVQVVFHVDESQELHQKAKSLRSEDLVMVAGKVSERDETKANESIVTGNLEIHAGELELISKSAELPFELATEDFQVGEETRLKYRYLDLRRAEMLEKMQTRSKMTNYFREYLLQKDFVEVETPMLTKSTPEGSRDFIVPSRLNKGKFYALPQSPQQYKQLLMVSGIERYFQVARCIRDEDLRADRGFEFTQLDLEMSFVDQELIMELIEEMVIYVVEKLGGKTILNKPFPRITEKEARAKYGDDKFDMRSDPKDPDTLAFAWVIDFPTFVAHEEKKDTWTYSHNPFTAPKEELIKTLMEIDPKRLSEPEMIEKINSLLSTQYDLVCNGYEVGGGGIRIHDPKALSRVFEIIGHSKERIQEEFGHMLEAFTYGAPPHGGIALGLDRMAMLLTNSKNLKEVIAFPMTGSGKTAIMEGPAPVEESQLVELGIELRGGKKRNVYDDIKTLLDSRNMKYKTIEHEAVLTSEEAAKARGTSIQSGAKALLIKAGDTFHMVVISAASKLDSKLLRKVLNSKKTRFASKEEVEEITSCLPGAVPPFGDLFGVPLWIDSSLGENINIDFNAGKRTHSIEMAYDDYLAISGGTLVQVTQ